MISVDATILSLDFCLLYSFISGLSNEEMAEQYARATICVTPSLYEGFGLPAAEAMSCAAPVVVTDGGALPEVAGDAARVVPAGNADALAAAIADLLDDPEARQALGQRARQRCLAEFSWDVCAARLVDHYRDAIAACRGRATSAAPPTGPHRGQGLAC